ncbi:Glycosyltransferase involved in cell wall biosynthesis (fragment) [Flavobacterium sp. 9AF]
MLVEAIKNLVEKGIKINLKIAGNLTDSFDINTIKNINEIQYLGIVNGEKKRDLLLQSNLICLPTFYKMEGQPISLIEGMATGNVILTTNHAGIPDICNEKNGFICLKDDLNSLQNSLEFICNLNREELIKISLFNYKMASEKYTLDIFINKLINIFYKCLN